LAIQCVIYTTAQEAIFVRAGLKALLSVASNQTLSGHLWKPSLDLFPLTALLSQTHRVPS